MYHVMNPQAASWSADLAAGVLDAYPDNVVQPLLFEEWVERLKASADEAENDENLDIEHNPALRLVDFYLGAIGAKESQRVLRATASTAASKTLREFGPLSRDWLDNWMVSGVSKQLRTSTVLLAFEFYLVRQLNRLGVCERA